ncbi:MAG: DNA repair protein RecN [Acidobacteria bacterium]|nr:DNA repair protein RecN [Acidobacteriota bacterium]
MLKYLKIKNLAIIEELEVEFSPGLNLLTGETGAGKSIIIDGVNLLLGEKSSPELIRSGEKEASVEGIFEPGEDGFIEERLKELDIDYEGELIIRRVVGEGKSRAFINGVLVPIRSLKALGEKLIDIHGQHQHQELLYPNNHLELLDYFGRNHSLREKVSSLARELRELFEELRSLRMDEREKMQKIDLLSFQVREIEEAHLKPGEEEELSAERKLLQNAERLHQLTASSLGILSESEPNLISLLSQLERNIDELAGIDESLRQHAKEVEDARYKIEDLSSELASYLSRITFDEERLSEIEERLLDINRLKRKYGNTIEEVLAFKEKAKRDLEKITMNEERKKELIAEIEKKYSEYLELAKRLSEKRGKDALELEKRVMEELSLLAMEKAEFRAKRKSISPPYFSPETEEFAPPIRGIDEVEFLISPNPGEELKPLARIASGGELSRLMLAIKSAASAEETYKTLIFDEIDIGIGGRVAEVVGRKLKRLARAHQIICITHLPQIAAFADAHFLVEKSVEGGRTKTWIKPLSPEERVGEIARMLGGERITETTRKHAEELIKGTKES